MSFKFCWRIHKQIKSTRTRKVYPPLFIIARIISRSQIQAIHLQNDLKTIDIISTMSYIIKRHVYFLQSKKKCLILQQQQNKQKQLENVKFQVHLHTNLLLLFVCFHYTSGCHTVLKDWKSKIAITDWILTSSTEKIMLENIHFL